jgi:hypothetical protein
MNTDETRIKTKTQGGAAESAGARLSLLVRSVLLPLSVFHP